MKTAFIYQEALSKGGFGPRHVLQPSRLQYTYELLEAYGAFQGASRVVPPRPAQEEELLSFHTREYVEAVKGVSRGDRRYNPARYNFSAQGDNPPYPGMFEEAVRAVGGSLVAAEMVARGEVAAVFNAAGGYHHAAPDCASGFCIFNDAAVTISYLVKQGMKVAYIDIDAHHGDGVQNAFYATDQVLTISLHEWGRYLFPGTGETDEIGEDRGRGYSVNIPLAPYTDDETYLWAFRQVVPPLVSRFGPDVVVTQLGCDTHFRDPLTHLSLTTQGYAQVLRELRQLSPRWLALGGGGYEMEVVARSWAIAYGIIMDRDWPDEIPQAYQERYGLKRLHDEAGPEIDSPARERARRFARKTVAELKKLVFPVHQL